MMLRRLVHGLITIILLHKISPAQEQVTINVNSEEPLYIGSAIYNKERIFIHTSTEQNRQLLISLPDDLKEYSSDYIEFSNKYVALNIVKVNSNKLIALGELYPSIGIKEISAITPINENGELGEPVLFTVQDGFSEIFDAITINGNVVLCGIGELPVVRSFGMLPTSVMLPQGFLAITDEELSSFYGYNISLRNEQGSFVWKLNNIVSVSSTSFIISGEVFTEWDQESMRPLDPKPFLARVQLNDKQPRIVWAITLPEIHGYANEIIIRDQEKGDLQIILISNAFDLSGIYITSIDISNGLVANNKTLFIPKVMVNNAIIHGDSIIVIGGTANSGKNEKLPGLFIVNIDKLTFDIVKITSNKGVLFPARIFVFPFKHDKFGAIGVIWKDNIYNLTLQLFSPNNLLNAGRTKDVKIKRITSHYLQAEFNNISIINIETSKFLNH